MQPPSADHQLLFTSRRHLLDHLLDTAVWRQGTCDTATSRLAATWPGTSSCGQTGSKRVTLPTLGCKRGKIRVQQYLPAFCGCACHGILVALQLGRQRRSSIATVASLNRRWSLGTGLPSVAARLCRPCTWAITQCCILALGFSNMGMHKFGRRNSCPLQTGELSRPLQWVCMLMFAAGAHLRRCVR